MIITMTSHQWLLGVCLLSVLASGLGLSLRRRVRNLERKVRRLGNDSTILQKEVTSLRNGLKELKDDVKGMNNVIDRLQQDVQELKSRQCDCDPIKRQLQQLTKRDDELEVLIRKLLTDDCSNKPCKHGGTCIDGVNSFTCHCPPGYTGLRCEEDMDECVNSPCHNGGTCVDQLNGFRCLCPPGYYGATCLTVDGRWTEWRDTGPCSKTCGQGIKTQTRYCIPPQHGGKPCDGPHQQTASCNVKPCPVDGRWTDWGPFGPCSRTCGTGVWSRVRSCIGPQHGGRDCEGPSMQTAACIVRPCPVDGEWWPWGPYTPCTRTCDPGTMTRTRSCKPPQHGGRPCQGPSLETKTCLIRYCPVDGQWGQWGPWGPCRGRCFDGGRTRTRQCNNPPPRHGGRSCVGRSTDWGLCGRPPFRNLPVDCIEPVKEGPDQPKPAV